MSAQSICQVCIMDDSDPDIQYAGADGCNHCISAKNRIASETFRGDAGDARLQEIVALMKAEGAGKAYDCLLGISGGVDSSYVAYRAKALGLRPLAVHLDNGWNSELAVHNIHRVIDGLGIDLITHVIDWEEIKDMQRACLRAPVLDVEIVSDHAIFAIMYKVAAQHGIRSILSGMNVTSESIMPRTWNYDKRDGRNLKAIHDKLGDGVRRKTYPFLMPWRFLYYVFVKRIRYITLLNYGDYNKQQAIALLQEKFDWKPYPNKHGESIFTRFYQDYYLPTKFGIDKRRAHYSSQIAALQISREDALAAMNTPLFRPEDLAQEKEYVLKKLGFSEAQWHDIMARPVMPHTAFANNAWMFRRDSKLTQFVRRVAKFEKTRAANPTGHSATAVK